MHILSIPHSPVKGVPHGTDLGADSGFGEFVISDPIPFRFGCMDYFSQSLCLALMR